MHTSCQLPLCCSQAALPCPSTPSTALNLGRAGGALKRLTQHRGGLGARGAKKLLQVNWESSFGALSMRHAGRPAAGRDPAHWRWEGDAPL